MKRDSATLDERLRGRLESDRLAGLERRLPPIREREGTNYELDGYRVVGFCSNDYLGFAAGSADHTQLDQPLGSGASRLVTGQHEIHQRVESRLSKLVGQQDAVLFPSGFQLNVGVLPALLNHRDSVYSDNLNHASLIDGMRLSGARPHRLPHLSAPPPARAHEPAPRWWVCESLYSMDGDGPSIERLRRHLGRGDWLYVDEAHAFGLYPGGASRTSHAGLRPQAQVLTFGKALGVAGAAVAGSQTVCEWIRTRARSFVFSTGMAPRLAEHVDQALDRLVSPVGDAARERLWANRDLLAQRLGVPAPEAPIFPLLIGEPRDAVTLSTRLLARGYHVQAIRPPTVPKGGSRLRITLSALHTRQEIDGLADALHEMIEHPVLSPSPARPDPRAQVS